MIQQEPQAQSRVNKPKKKLGSNDTYYLYSTTTKSPVSASMYRIIVNKFMQFFFSLILGGERLKLPEGLGNLYIAGIKSKIHLDKNGTIRGAAPDWVQTKKLWDSNPIAKEAKKLVYCLNEATNGIRYKLIWDKRMMKVLNQSFYSIQLARVNKRSIYRAIKSGMEYIVYND